MMQPSSSSEQWVFDNELGRKQIYFVGTYAVVKMENLKKLIKFLWDHNEMGAYM